MLRRHLVMECNISTHCISHMVAVLENTQVALADALHVRLHCACPTWWVIRTLMPLNSCVSRNECGQYLASRHIMCGSCRKCGPWYRFRTIELHTLGQPHVRQVYSPDQGWTKLVLMQYDFSCSSGSSCSVCSSAHSHPPHVCCTGTTGPGSARI